MPALPPNFYGHWRISSGLVTRLRDEDDHPPERLLQAIWQHQRLLRDKLLTLDGQTVRILHPGFRSVEGGPDFREAILQFDENPAVTGDVEVDLRSSGWRSHGHHENPAFKNVILHVLWECDKPVSGTPPAISLRRVLDAALGDLSQALGNESPRSLPENLRGKCCAPLRELSAEQQTALLHQAALVRLQNKAGAFQARARQAGWEQSLWEGLFRALGYKHNTWPMQRLAELRSRWLDGTPLSSEARLFGISGLLPSELNRTELDADHYLRRIWDQWWRDRNEFADCILPRELWRFHGLRPANHPQRRLALAARWSNGESLPARLEAWCARSIPNNELAESLLEALLVEPDDFWSWHCTFRSTRLKHAQPLLGIGRLTDLAVNVILPWLWIRASGGKNHALRQTIEQRYFEWPVADDNSLLRLARQRLLGNASRRALTDAAAQQGLIQIVRDFCEHSNALCDQCRFPELVREWHLSNKAA